MMDKLRPVDVLRICGRLLATFPFLASCASAEFAYLGTFDLVNCSLNPDGSARFSTPLELGEKIIVHTMGLANLEGDLVVQDARGRDKVLSNNDGTTTIIVTSGVTLNASLDNETGTLTVEAVCNK